MSATELILLTGQVTTTTVVDAVGLSVAGASLMRDAFVAVAGALIPIAVVFLLARAALRWVMMMAALTGGGPYHDDGEDWESDGSDYVGEFDDG